MHTGFGVQQVIGSSLMPFFFFFLSLRSHYGRKLYFYFYSFLISLVCYAFQSIATFVRVLLFILVFTILCMMWPSNFDQESVRRLKSKRRHLHTG